MNESVIVRYGLERLIRLGALLVPHGYFPGSVPGGDDLSVFDSEDAWNDYAWNPPAGMDVAFDFEASAKPQWSELIGSGYSEARRVYSERALSMLDAQASSRITRAYGESTWSGEIQTRLASEADAAADAERERLKARHAEIEAWIRSERREPEDLMRLDVMSDSVWENENWEIPK